MQASAPSLNALIVDDDRGVRNAVGQVLASAGHRAFETGSPEEAIDLVRTIRIHYSILDVHLKSTTGLVLLADLRTVAERLPAIFMSAAFTPELRAGARALGARACLDKPLDIRALRCAVQEIIDQEVF